MDEEVLPKILQNPPQIFKGDWQKCFVDWLFSVYLQRKREKTIINYASVIRRLYAKHPGATPGDLETHDFLVFLDRPKKNGKNLAPSSRNYDLSTIRSFHSYAQNYGVKRHNKVRSIFEGIDMSRHIKYVEEETDRRAFDEGEIPLFFSQIDRSTLIGKRDRAIFLFLLLTGRRVSEVIGLRWEDIREMQIEGGSFGVAYRWLGKRRMAKSAWRQLDATTWNAILDYLRFSKRLEHMKPTSALFVSQKSQFVEEPVSYSAVARRFREYLHAAGLREEHGNADLTIHSWRATYAVESFEDNGHNLEATMREMDHKHEGMTLRYIRKGRRKAQQNTASSAIQRKYNL